MTVLPFELETELEKRIAADPEWQEGIDWGKPRTGHLEGTVKYHIADVLANIDRQCPGEEERRDLRLVALIHDAFKYRVDESRPKMVATIMPTSPVNSPSVISTIRSCSILSNCMMRPIIAGVWVPTATGGIMRKSAWTICYRELVLFCLSTFFSSMPIARTIQRTPPTLPGLSNLRK